MHSQGFYYLHTNGDLIYKRDADGGAIADARESSFVRAVWPVYPESRACAWDILVESLAAGADKNRVFEIASKWDATNEDAANYAWALGFNLSMDGNQYCATRSDFVDLQNSPAGFGDTALEAISELVKELGYKPSKMWAASFKDLVSQKPKELTVDEDKQLKYDYAKASATINPRE